MEVPAFVLPLSGLLAGIILGFVGRRNFFCTLTWLEQYWYAQNSDGIRTWVLTALVATMLTQTYIFTGIFEPEQSFYLSSSFSWLGAIIGGLTFGFGMALIGTCGFGALLRLGGGSLKSFVAILVLGIVALSTQRGLLSFTRTDIVPLEPFVIFFNGNQSIPSVLSELFGRDIEIFVILIILIAAAFFVFKDKDFRTKGVKILAASIIGLVVSLGWLITSYIAERSFETVQIESASFVSPVSDLFMQFGLSVGTMPDYGLGMVIGVVIGAAIAAKSTNDVRWEACDDARELRRHIMGAAFMGFGGVLAVGCTIGQGVSAASLLALSVPITMTSIIIGSRMGLGFLIEGSIFAPFIRR